MRKSLLILTTVAVVATVIAAGAVAWYLSEPWRERRAFVGKCLANGFTEPTCACTFTAHKELPASYATLVKSIVHDDMTTFAINTSVVFGRKAATIGTGIDPGEIANAVRAVENKTVGAVLRQARKLLVRHKYQAVGAVLGGSKAMAIYRAGRVSVEIGQAVAAVEKHCGILAASIPTSWDRVKGAAGDVWETTKGAADVALQSAKEVAGKAVDATNAALEGTKEVTGRAVDATKDAADKTRRTAVDVGHKAREKVKEVSDSLWPGRRDDPQE